LAPDAPRITLPTVLATAAAAITLPLLGASGIAKLFDPDPTSGALERAHLPHGQWAARALGAAEVTAAVAGLVLGGAWLVPAMLMYAGFTFFTLAAVRGTIPLQSCGCFGRADTPATYTHAVYNAVAAVALGFSAAIGARAFSLGQSPVELVIWWGFAGIGAYLSYLLLSEFPKTVARANR
jgi:hypothetical protein